MKNIYTKLIELEDEGKMIIDISYRGGMYGLPIGDFMNLFNIPSRYESYLPNKVGAYCNYLGGGLRGSIVGGGYNNALPKKYAQKVDRYIDACKVRYHELENGMNDEIDENGETNWDAVGTNASRMSGIVSAY